MKKKTTTKRKKAMLRKIKKQALKKKRSLIANTNFLKSTENTTKTANDLKSRLLKIQQFLNKEKNSFCFLLSMIFTLNSAGANLPKGVDNFSDKQSIPIEDVVLPSILENTGENIELLDAIPEEPIEELPTLTVSEVHYSNITTNLISTFEKEQEVQNKEHLSVEQLNYLLELMQAENCPFSSIFTTREEALNRLYESETRTYEEIMLIIMARDGYTYQELDEVCAGCVAESKGEGTCYKDAYAVASIFLNRTNYIPYINAHSTNMHEQFIAPGQFGVYFDKSYLNYLGRIDLIGYQAALDAFYSKYSMHDYLEFRGSWEEVNGKYEQFAENGNKYTVMMKDNNRVINDEYVESNEVPQLILKINN